jgi:cell division protein FtsB
MKVSHFTVSLLVALCVYLSGTLLFGRYSGPTFSELQSHISRLETNLDELLVTRNELEAQIELLRRSREAIRVAARDLQYYRPGESVVRVDGYSGPTAIMSPGSILQYEMSHPDNRPIIRTIALAVFLLSLFIQILLSRPARGHSVIARASR